MIIKKYVKKAIPVEVIQLNPETIDEVRKFVGRKGKFWTNGHVAFGDIYTEEGTFRCDDGSYIVKGIEGEFWAVKKSIFEKTYEEVGDGN